jgi:hypothetical protein
MNPHETTQFTVGRAYPATTLPQQPFTLNTDRTAAVSNDAFWNEDMAACPRSTKILLLGRGGVALLGQYDGDPFYVGWFALPRRKP